MKKLSTTPRFLLLLATILTIVALPSCKSPPTGSQSSELTHTEESGSSWKTLELKIGYGKCNPTNKNEGCLEVFYINRNRGEFALYGLRSEWVRVPYSSSELQEIDSILSGHDFQNMVSAQEICEKDPAWRGGVRVMSENGKASSLGLQGDCIRAHLTEEDRGNPLHRLFVSLEKIKKRALSCPAWDSSLKNAESYDLVRVELPISWPCFTCKGMCQ